MYKKTMLHFGCKECFSFVYQQTIISSPCSMEIRGRYKQEKDERRKNRILLMPADTAHLVRVEYIIHKLKDIGILKLVLHSTTISSQQYQTTKKYLMRTVFSQVSLVARNKNLVKLIQVKRLLKEYKRIAEKQ